MARTASRRAWCGGQTRQKPSWKRRTPTDTSAQDAYVSGDNTAFGRLPAEYLVKQLGGKGNIVALRGIATTLDNERMDAFKAVIDKHPDIKLLDARYANWNRDDAFKVMQDYLTRFKHIDAVLAADDDMAFGVLRAIEQAKRTDIKEVFGGAGAKGMVKAIIDGSNPPWPQRPAGLVEQAFAELARRWTPVLDAFDAAGVDVSYELHPGEDLHDGLTFERFLDGVGGHSRANILYDPSHFVLQQLDYLAFIDIYHERIKSFHVKDAEFRPSGRQGVYGGFANWVDRAGRFRSLGDGQVDFGGIFSRMAQYDYDGWAVLEWECCLKHPEQGAAEGAPFIDRHIIRVADSAFDDFAKSAASAEQYKKLLGID